MFSVSVNGDETIRLLYAPTTQKVHDLRLTSDFPAFMTSSAPGLNEVPILLLHVYKAATRQTIGDAAAVSPCGMLWRMVSQLSTSKMVRMKSKSR